MNLFHLSTVVYMYCVSGLQSLKFCHASTLCGKVTRLSPVRSPSPAQGWDSTMVCPRVWLPKKSAVVSWGCDTPAKSPESSSSQLPWRTIKIVIIMSQQYIGTVHVPLTTADSSWYCRLDFGNYTMDLQEEQEKSCSTYNQLTNSSQFLPLLHKTCRCIRWQVHAICILISNSR